MSTFSLAQTSAGNNVYRLSFATGDAIHAIRQLAHGFEAPGDACNTFRLTYQKLKEFEADLHKHVHLENNLLFPKAAQL